MTLAEAEEALRRDRAGAQWNGRAERRWITPKEWGIGGWRWARGVARELLVADIAHERLAAVWRMVKRIDDSAYGKIRDLAGGGKWSADLPRQFVRSVVVELLEAGVAQEGPKAPVWFAVERAAIRAASRVRDRHKTYGWTRPYGPRDVVTTIRLPFGAWKNRPLSEVASGYWRDDDLLGTFATRAVPKWALEKEFFDPAPIGCDYAEAALLSGGWAVRFVAVRPAEGAGPPLPALDE
jgi:hypothetical protein